VTTELTSGIDTCPNCHEASCLCPSLDEAPHGAYPNERITSIPITGTVRIRVTPPEEPYGQAVIHGYAPHGRRVLVDLGAVRALDIVGLGRQFVHHLDGAAAVHILGDDGEAVDYLERTLQNGGHE
jgi:hypothetical protein